MKTEINFFQGGTIVLTLHSKGIPTAKQHDKELGSYYDATRQGIEPISTKQKDIDAAVRFSNETGNAFDGNKLSV
jgi:hypothetical protein